MACSLSAQGIVWRGARRRFGATDPRQLRAGSAVFGVVLAASRGDAMPPEEHEGTAKVCGANARMPEHEVQARPATQRLTHRRECEPRRDSAPAIPKDGAALGFTFHTRVSRISSAVPQPQIKHAPTTRTNRPGASEPISSASRDVCDDAAARKVPSAPLKSARPGIIGAPTTRRRDDPSRRVTLALERLAHVRHRVSRETTGYPHSLTRSEPPRRSRRQTRSSAQMTAVPMRSITLLPRSHATRRLAKKHARVAGPRRGLGACPSFGSFSP
jgi:hypothetical protein